MKIFRYSKDEKLYTITQIVRSMCLCGSNKFLAYPYKHDGRVIEFWKKDLDQFVEVAEYARAAP